MLALICHHPASDHATKMRAKQLADRYKISLPAPPALDRAGNLALTLEHIQLKLASSGQVGSAVSPLPPVTSPLIEPLTPRELEILHLIANGLTNPNIAATLIITVGTVKAHSHRIYGKLNVTNRVQAIARARELGLL